MNHATEKSDLPIDLSRFEVGASYREQRVPACSVDFPFLKRILGVLRAAAENPGFSDLNPESPGAMAAKSLPEEGAAVVRAVSVTASGSEGEVLHWLNDDDGLSADKLPETLTLVTFETGTSPGITSPVTPPNRVTLRLDCSKPPPFDFSDPSGEPTPNTSILIVQGWDLWASGTYSKLLGLLRSRKTRWGWLHAAGSYGALFFAFGIPAALSLGVLVDRLLGAAEISPTLHTAVLVYAFVSGLVLFRLCFSVVRWLYPYLEITTDRAGLAMRFRLFILAILASAVGSLLVLGLTSIF